ncbi:MAG: multiheme c-type cytochrome, partial [Sedimentisphaerales bacterium]
MIVILVVATLAAAGNAVVSETGLEAPGSTQSDDFSGSVSCRQCHERFYKLWAPSHHGLAMQPYTAEFASANLTLQAADIKIGRFQYLAEIEADKGWVREIGPEGKNTYPMVHVLGGKNVYYFLTPYEKGRLQTLPVAFDVNKKQWFDTAASGVRHFPGMDRDEPVHWTDPLYTFNTSCYNCHVSQLSTNYDLKTDTYHTTWAEPGINCETCHGPADQHVKVYQQAAATGDEPDDLKLISTKPFSVEQTNSMCNSCHAKMSPVSASFKPGDKYFDHFNLITLENPDFYPDGRDLGENYTMTSWRMSPCVKSGKLDCMHCHTSSGRYRFTDSAKANHACMPCHKERVENTEAHTHHPADSEASKCIACHMPMTKFAHMNRSDHSMRPPAPAATLAFKSPNACNLCHVDEDEDAAWAD